MNISNFEGRVSPLSVRDTPSPTLQEMNSEGRTNSMRRSPPPLINQLLSRNASPVVEVFDERPPRFSRIVHPFPRHSRNANSAFNSVFRRTS